MKGRIRGGTNNWTTGRMLRRPVSHVSRSSFPVPAHSGMPPSHNTRPRFLAHSSFSTMTG